MFIRPSSHAVEQGALPEKQPQNLASDSAGKLLSGVGASWLRLTSIAANATAAKSVARTMLHLPSLKNKRQQ